MKDNLFSHDSIRASERAATASGIDIITIGVTTVGLIVISLNSDFATFPWALMIVGIISSLGFGLGAGARGEAQFDWRRFVSVGGGTLAGFGGFALLFALFFSR